MSSRGKLFRKYAFLIGSLVGAALMINGAINAYFTHWEIRVGLLELEREKALSAATRIDQYVGEIVHQMGWTALPSVVPGGDAVTMRQLDFIKLLRQVPAISEIAEIDANGRERLRISRLLMDVLGSDKDRSADPAFVAARGGKTYFGPVYFHKETEPYMSIAISSRKGSVTVAEVNLKFIWDVITQIRIGQRGFAYVVGPLGKLVAHPDISLVLKQVDMGMLPQVQAALKDDSPGNTGTVDDAHDATGQPVLTAYAHVRPLGWTVFVEQPKQEAYAPLHKSMMRNGVVLVGAVVLAMFASLFLARRMVDPIRTLREAAAAVGSGELNRRIDISSGDEVEELAEQFNTMAAKLTESYAGLESKVAQRTAELSAEQAKTRSLLCNILPETVIDELAETGHVRTVRHENVTIMFTDFVGFTQATSTMPADRMVAELNDIFAVFDQIVYEEKIEKIKTIGDAYMAAAGLSENAQDHAQCCVRAALRILEHIEERNRSAAFKWQLRVGMHSGPVVSGVVGERKYAYDIWGDAVNIASRMESSGEVGQVNISAYTYDLIREEFDCSYRGKVAVKGKGDVDMYFVRHPSNSSAPS